MKAVQTSRFLMFAFLTLACTGALAQQPPPSVKAVKARELLEQKVSALDIPGGTSLAVALERLFAPTSIHTTNIAGQTVKVISWGTSSNAELLPVPAMNLDSIPIKDALAKITEAVGADYSMNFNGSGASVTIAVSRKPSSDMKRPVYFEFPGWPLEAVMKSLLEGTGINYVLGPGLNNLTVNATLKGVSLETALEAVLRAVGAGYTREGSVINVSSSAALSQFLVNAQTRQAAPNATANSRLNNVAPQRDQKVVSRAVETQNINPSEIAPIITQQGLQVVSTNKNRSVITGPEQQVNEAATLIAALDSVESLPRPVKISATAKAVWNVTGKRPATAMMNPTISTPENTEASTGLTTQTKGTAGVPGMEVDFRLRAVPVVLSNGKISVSGSFAFRWTVGENNVNHVVFSSQEVPITASLDPQKQQCVATIRMGGEKEGSEGVLEVFLTASVEDGRVSPGAKLGTPGRP